LDSQVARPEATEPEPPPPPVFEADIPIPAGNLLDAGDISFVGACLAYLYAKHPFRGRCH